MEKDIIDKLREEDNELFGKILKLEDFINSNKFTNISKPHKHLLQIQFEAMRTYHNILLARISELSADENTETINLNECSEGHIRVIEKLDYETELL